MNRNQNQSKEEHMKDYNDDVNNSIDSNSTEIEYYTGVYYNRDNSRRFRISEIIDLRKFKSLSTINQNNINNNSFKYLILFSILSVFIIYILYKSIINLNK